MGLFKKIRKTVKKGFKKVTGTFENVAKKAKNTASDAVKFGLNTATNNLRTVGIGRRLEFKPEDFNNRKFGQFQSKYNNVLAVANTAALSAGLGLGTPSTSGMNTENLDPQLSPGSGGSGGGSPNSPDDESDVLGLIKDNPLAMVGIAVLLALIAFLIFRISS